MSAPLILVDAWPRTVATGAPVEVRLAGGGGAKPYRYGGNGYRAGIKALPTVVAMLDFKGDDLGGGSVPEALVLRWAPAGQAGVAELGALHWRDAAITIRIGPEGALPPALQTGKVLDASTQDGELVIALSDLAADLKKPLLTDRYAGTGGIEGPVEWQDKIKRRAWGRVFNLAGEMIDKANNILAFGDPTRPWQAFDALRDKGAAAANMTVLPWQGSVAATFAALQAASAPQGGGVACPSIACVKWWTEPAGALCADIRGEIGAGYVETAPAIVERVAAVLSAVPFAAGTVAAAAAARPAAVGVIVSSETTTAANVLDQLLGDVSLTWLLDDAQILIRQWAWGASAVSGRSLGVSRKSTYRPVARRRLGYRRNQTVMTRDAIAGIVLASDVSFGEGSVADAIKDKTRTWDGSTPPSFAESDPNDVWLDPNDKGRRYLRSGGRLTIGEDTLTFGGDYLVLSPGWYAEDGSVRTYSQDTPPTNHLPGTRWHLPGSGQEFEWDPVLSNWMPIADITSLNTVTVTMAGLTLAADYLGVVAEELLPAVLTPQVTLGGADVRTADATHYAIANIIGGLSGAGVVTVNNTDGSADKGRVTLSDDYAGPGSFDLVVTVGADEQPAVNVVIEQNNAQPPTGGAGSGGGGGGGGVAIRATADLTGQRAGGSYAAFATFPGIVVASGETPVTTLAITYTYKAVPDGDSELLVKWQYAVAGSGSWVDFSSGGGLGPASGWDAGAHVSSPATFSFTDGETLAAGTYDFRLLAARNAVVGNITVATGNASVGISV